MWLYVIFFRQLTFLDELEKVYKRFALLQNPLKSKLQKGINEFGEDIDYERVQQAIDITNEQLPAALPISDSITNIRPSSRLSNSVLGNSNVVSRATSARSSRNGNAPSVFDTVDYTLYQVNFFELFNS